jgi:anti-sigma B factor antagonist
MARGGTGGGRQVVVVRRFGVEVDLRDDRVAVVRVAGDIDMSTTPELTERALPVAETGPPGMVVDLSDVSFMGAAGLHVLEGLQEALRHRGGELAVVAPGGIALRVLEVTGLDRSLGVTSSYAAARARLG